VTDCQQALYVKQHQTLEKKKLVTSNGVTSHSKTHTSPSQRNREKKIARRA